MRSKVGLGLTFVVTQIENIFDVYEEDPIDEKSGSQVEKVDDSSSEKVTGNINNNHTKTGKIDDVTAKPSQETFVRFRMESHSKLLEYQTGINIRSCETQIAGKPTGAIGTRQAQFTTPLTRHLEWCSKLCLPGLSVAKSNTKNFPTRSKQNDFIRNEWVLGHSGVYFRSNKMFVMD